jgi:hypothetical protein
MDLWLACLVLTHPHLNQQQQLHLLQLQILEPRVSVFSFFNRGAFFGRLSFALLVLVFRAAFSSLFFYKHVVRVALLFGPLAPCLAVSAVAHLGGSQTVPWPLVWDSWPPLSFALPDQPPPPDHLENHLIWVDSIKVISLACCRMSLECLVGTLMTLSLQLWN